MRKIFNYLKKLLLIFNYTIEHKNAWYKRQENYLAEIKKKDLNFLQKISRFSMCTPANHWAIIQSINHIKSLKLEGDLVECGVFEGGNIILYQYLNKKNNLKKKIYAYDTFEGMTRPGKIDRDFKNNSAIRIKQNNSRWCYSDLETVKKNIISCNQSLNNFIFIKGDVLKTLNNKKNLPKKISLLRLDTDFYNSTLKELNILYPRLVKNGVLIIDDYGHWKGSKKAVDKYFNLKKKFKWFQRIDYASRLYIKK